jgi:hypothetical protein
MSHAYNASRNSSNLRSRLLLLTLLIEMLGLFYADAPKNLVCWVVCLLFLSHDSACGLEKVRR